MPMRLHKRPSRPIHMCTMEKNPYSVINFILCQYSPCLEEQCVRKKIVPHI